MTSTYKLNNEWQIKRDHEIFHFLGSGVATSHQIRQALFIHDNGKIMSRQACECRLHKLVAMGYLVKRQYSGIRRVVTLFGLAERGIDELAKSTDLERDHIRSGMPNPEKLVHELMLSAVMRIIRDDARNNVYKLVYVYDDTVMKNITRPTRGIYYPDLLVRVLCPNSGLVTFFLELDAGNKSKKYWVYKISSWANITLVLTLNIKRLEIMKQYVLISGRKQITVFAVADTFLKTGLSGTLWEWLPKQERARLKLD